MTEPEVNSVRDAALRRGSSSRLVWAPFAEVALGTPAEEPAEDLFSTDGN